jgi:hypothetical protein
MGRSLGTVARGYDSRVFLGDNKLGAPSRRKWVNVIQHKPVGERSGNYSETFDDEIDVI